MSWRRVRSCVWRGCGPTEWGTHPSVGTARVGEDRVAGIVYCKDSDYGYWGFEAF